LVGKEWKSLVFLSLNIHFVHYCPLYGFRGRRDLSPDPRGPTAGLAWLEVWGIDDVLFLFGLPDDPSKTLKTTYMRAVLQD